MPGRCCGTLLTTANPFPARSMILIITVLASIYFSVCPSDRDYLNRVMEEIKVRVWTGAAFASALLANHPFLSHPLAPFQVKNKKALTNLGSAIDRQAGSVEMVDVKKALKGK